MGKKLDDLVEALEQQCEDLSKLKITGLLDGYTDELPGQSMVACMHACVYMRSIS